MKVVLMNDHNAYSALAKFDRFFDFSTVAGERPAWVAVGANYQIPNIFCNVWSEGSPKTFDSLCKLFPGVLRGSACETEY